MKQPAFLLVSSLVAVLPFFACEDSSNNGQDAGATNDAQFNVPETSVAPGTDAAMPTDGAAPTDAADAASATSATVSVTKAGAADPGVSVVFQDATGAVT